jgi:DNA uptake protein ComE-like DNA-binding protein
VAQSMISLPDLGAALAGLGALSAASFGLLDSTKAFWGGVSNIGKGHLKTALTPFDAPLTNALGQDGWWPVIYANWISGVAKADQKAKAQALIKLGLNAANAAEIAVATHVDPTALKAAVQRLETGVKSTDQDLNVLGRMSATIDVLLDAAFEAADQQYRNTCRLLAGLVAIGLAFGALALWPKEAGPPPTLAATFMVGLLAVPLAPVAKDLTGALSAAMNALKAAKKL